MKHHLKTSFDSIRRTPFQALAAITVLAVTFLVSTLLVITVYGTNQILQYFETRPQVIAFLTEEAEQGQIDELMGSLENDQRIKEVKFVSKEEAAEIYRNATSDNPLLGELVSPSIFPASIEFSVANLELVEDMIAEVSSNEIVDEVGFTASLDSGEALGEVLQRLRNVSTYVRIGGLIAISILSATSFLVLMVIVGMRITTKKKEIDSLTLIGATPFFIKAPIILEATIYSLIGVLAGWLGAVVILLYVTPSVVGYFGPIEVIPKDINTLFLLLCAVLAVEIMIGLFIALFGSMVAVSRSLRMVK